jgi:hypothetical protein
MQDFTKFTMGQMVDGELIVVCPYCHRYAVKREYTSVRFVHSIGTVQTDGRVELVDDSCPKAPIGSVNPSRIID